MNKIKEVITALSSEESTALRVRKEEQEPMSDERVRILTGRAVEAVAIICGTILIKDAEPVLGFFLGVLSLMLALIYFVSKM